LASRLKGITRALRETRGADARFVSRCTRALQALQSGALHTDLLPLGARIVTRGVLTSQLMSVGRNNPWPYAFTRQTDPRDPGFLPRSLLPLHLNLSFRDWATVGLPGVDREAIVDPGGWITPLRDGPSIAVWVGDSRRMWTMGPLPGWGEDAELDLHQERIAGSPLVRTTARRADITVQVDAWPLVVQGKMVFGVTARVRLDAPAPRPVRVGFAIRPANPEGVAPTFSLERRDDGWWLADGRPFAFVPHPGDTLCLSTWARGDAYGRVGGMLRDRRSRGLRGDGADAVNCPVGMATGCEIYRTNLSPGETFKRTLYAAADVEVGDALRRSSASRLVAGARADWEGITRAGARFELPVHGGVFDSCRTTLLALLDRGAVTAGPFTYHDFWYRDAAYHLAALARLGFLRQAAEVLATWPGRQDRSGAWLAHGGAWDGTGGAIWALVDHVRLSGDLRLLKETWPALQKAARYLMSKQVDGLMPAGASASHLGPPDRYYWDACWACAGLREAARAARWMKKEKQARAFSMAHGEMLDRLRVHMGEGPVPAAPGRAMDSAAATVLAGVWPLGIFSASEPALRKTARWLLDHCMHDGGLFHDVVHSGVSPYLTCGLAQYRICRSDPGAAEHLDHLAANASPAGGWPEAYLPGRGGVMGDGEMAWAAASFAMLCRNLILREDGATLHLFQGADARWWGDEVVVEGAPTAFGPSRLHLRGGELRLDADWREAPTRVIWHKPEGVEGVLRVNGGEARGEGARIEVAG